VTVNIAPIFSHISTGTNSSTPETLGALALPLLQEISETYSIKENLMLRAALVFFVLALVAILFGATGFAGVSMDIGKLLLMVFLVLAVVSFAISLVSGRRTNLSP
jgi:uncharacterized membrane protein YtjA (UPF0391 family)